MKAALIVTNAASMVRLFNENNIKLLVDEGYEVHIACNFEKNNTFPKEQVEECVKDWTESGLILHQFPTDRSPFSLSNLKAYFVLKKLLKEKHFDLIHCHAPISSVVCRLAAKKYRKKGTKVMYTAHGFHFFKGAPFINWLIYFPIEWVCSFFTDVQITINTEDFAFAKKYLHAKRVDYIPGVGVDTQAIKNINIDRSKKRAELGIPEDCIAVLSVGELNDNKNHETILRAIAKLNHMNIYYIICGIGKKEDCLKGLAEQLGLSERLILLGYRNDISEIDYCCDIFAFPSKREGLGRAALEAMAAGLPIIGSDIHGIPDYLIDGRNGYKCPREDVDVFAERIEQLANNRELCLQMGQNNIDDVKRFDISNVKSKTKEIYYF